MILCFLNLEYLKCSFDESLLVFVKFSNKVSAVIHIIELILFFFVFNIIFLVSSSEAIFEC